MKRLAGTVASLAVGLSVVLLGPGIAQASSTTCDNGSTSGATFYSPGGGSATINENTAWRFRAQRTNSGEFYVGAFSGDGASGLISQNSSTAGGTWVGRWSSNYSALANSVKVTNYGQATTFTYDRSCTTV